jgi:molybdopterin-guanine dinucleotide biosynthesis protein A
MACLNYNLSMISIAIQAGGESRRMGQDKALMPFLGRNLLERVMKRVSSLGDDLFITTNYPSKYQAYGVPLYRDVMPGNGALGGLLTALSSAKNPILVVVACDMPFVNRDILALAIDRLQSNRVDVAIPHSKKGYEPFHAVYRLETCLPAVKAALDSGERRLISWFPAVNVSPINEDVLLEYDPRQVAFWNVNTIEDFQNAEKLAIEIDS